MPRVMFTISYGVKPERRDEYLSLIHQMRDHLTTVIKKDYSVYEAKGRKNYFTEVFVTASMEEYDALEDNLDEKAQSLVSSLEGLIDDEGMKYTTLIALE